MSGRAGTRRVGDVATETAAPPYGQGGRLDDPPRNWGCGCPQDGIVTGSQIMMVSMAERPDESETTSLVERASRGDQSAWERLLARDRDRLRRMVALRLDRRLQGRVDPSDVIQEACLDAARRFAEYRKGPAMPFFLWL